MKVRQLTTCDSCRKRKLACDGKTPACSQCALRGRACPGYQHDLIFRTPIVAGPQRTTPKAHKRSPRSPYPGTKTQKLPPKLLDDTTGHLAKAIDAETRYCIRLGIASSRIGWPFLDIVSLVIQNFIPYRAPILARQGEANCSNPVARVCGAWVEALPGLIQNEQAERLLMPSIKTLAISMLSKGNSGLAPISDALVSYAQALPSLRLGLQNRNGSNSDVLLAAIICLFMSETFLPKSAIGATIHAKGIGDFFQSQSPEYYSSGLGHKLFAGIQPVLLVHSLMTHENTFLADERWLTVPFSRSGTAPLQNLLREISSLSSALIEAEQSLKFPTKNSCASAYSLFLRFEQSLENSMNLEEALKNGDQEIHWLPIYPLQDGTNLSFPNITSANFFTHLWALRILCIYYITQLVSRFPSLSVRIKPYLRTSISVDMVVHLSSLILRSMDYLSSEEFKLSGAASTIMPLRVVHDVITKEETHNEDLYAWRQRVVQTFRSRGYQFLVERALGL